MTNNMKPYWWDRYIVNARLTLSFHMRYPDKNIFYTWEELN